MSLSDLDDFDNDEKIPMLEEDVVVCWLVMMEVYSSYIEYQWRSIGTAPNPRAVDFRIG